MKTSIILLGHGSQAKGGNTALAEMARLVDSASEEEVTFAYLQFKSPSLSEAVEAAIAGGAGRIIVMPYFLYTGNHVRQDIPREIGRLMEKHPGVEILLTGHIGVHPKLAEIVLERIKSYL